MKNKTLISTFLFFSAIAIVAGLTAYEQASHHPATSGGGLTNAQNLAPGFYRSENDTIVYKVEANRSGCVVRSGTQMAAFGGFQRVTILAASVSVASSIKGHLTPCGWPDGLYRIEGTKQIYEVTYGRPCKATDGTASREVFPLPADADFLPARGTVKTCGPTKVRPSSARQKTTTSS